MPHLFGSNRSRKQSSFLIIPHHYINEVLKHIAFVIPKTSAGGLAHNASSSSSLPYNIIKSGLDSYYYYNALERGGEKKKLQEFFLFENYSNTKCMKILARLMRKIYALNFECNSSSVHRREGVRTPRFWMGFSRNTYFSFD